MSSRRGFTLIELLIVVAIIAILALIAVPNFLEAQTRSKVSRVYADMRSLAVAFESYATDNAVYPPMLRPFPLTTPIAYVTSLPIDAFGTDDRRQIVKRTFEYVSAEAERAHNPGTNWRSHSFYLDYYAFYPPYLDPFNRPSAVPSHLGKPPALWQLKSWGPDRLDHRCPAGPGDDFSLAYDPTNGTISHGDLCRFGP
jgi:prepilin-type N-terminal cleavage/methylation domain-containing protein